MKTFCYAALLAAIVELGLVFLPISAPSPESSSRVLPAESPVSAVSEGSSCVVDPEALKAQPAVYWEHTTSLSELATVLPETLPQLDWTSYNPESLTVMLEGLPVRFERSSYTDDFGGRKLWVGRNANRLDFVVAAGAGEDYFAVIGTTDGSYSVQVNNGTLLVKSTFDDRPISCPSDLALNALPGPELPHSTQSAADTAEETFYTIDLALFIDQASLAVEKYDESALITKMVANLGASNQELLNSQITNFAWKLNALVIVPSSVYTFSNDMGVDVGLMCSAGNPLSTLVQKTLSETGSDEAHLLVTGGGSWGGMAYVSWRYGMTRYDQLFYRSMTHELGHNFGSYHDRITDGAVGRDPDNYRFGFMFVDTAKYYWTTSKIYTGDIMSYATNRMPYFANPKVLYNYSSKDSAGVVHEITDAPMGVEVGQPDAANGSLYISENAARMAGYNTLQQHHITWASASRCIGAGTDTEFTVNTTDDGNATFQWYKDGAAISGATSANYKLTQVSSLNAGEYSVVVRLGGKTFSPLPSVLSVSPQSELNTLGRAVNISTRAMVKSGFDNQVAGFVISGNTPMQVLIRAAGPALVPFNVDGTLADPVLTLFDDKGVAIQSNDNWEAAELQQVSQAVGAFNWTVGSKDAAMLVTLEPGLYTAQVSGKGDCEGIGLVEVYAVQGNTSRMVNISTRSLVSEGSKSQVAGFVIGGQGLKTMLIRAGGPALLPLGISAAAEDTVLTLRDVHGKVIASNDDWCEGTETGALIKSLADTIHAYPWTSGSKDAALLVSLPPGTYTATVTAKTGTKEGVGLIEVYEVK